jgi:CBS domain-containing protein
MTNRLAPGTIIAASFSSEYQRRGALMRVKHVMTKNPSCCLPSDDTVRAAGIMRNEDTGIVPVIDNEQSLKIVGVVTDRDLCMNVVAEGRDPRTVAVDACMTQVVVTCSPNDSVAKAIELMKDNQIRRVPVVDEQGRLQGIVAMADLVGRGDLPMAETHETLKRVSTITPEPSKPRARSRNAAA